jgi:cobalt/nickel transport system permease protein
MAVFASLFAVHLSDGVLEPIAWGPATVLAALLVVVESTKLNDNEIPRLGVFTAAVFVASQIHIPVAGSSVHLLLNGIAGIVLGWRSFIAIAVAVLLQALLFAHGGLTTWGVNTLTMALPAILAGLVFRRAYQRWPTRAFGLGFFIGCATASLTVHAACAILYFGGISSLSAVGVVLMAHLPVIALEGVITASLVHYLSRVKPEWLR